jgi:predicted extracellular nuclease
VSSVEGAADARADSLCSGAPGGNIRPAFLYRTDRVKLAGNAPAGNATQAVSVSGSPAQLSLNPGRIAPADPAWRASRKPIVAQFEKLE